MTDTNKLKNARATVGIIVPAYNYARYLDQCIGSVIAQTYTDFTVLIIDNASSDNTQEIAEAWVTRDPRVRYVRNDTNLGLGPSLCKAYELLDNELMMMLSADDYLAPSFLEHTVGALARHPECVYAYSAWEGAVDRPGHPNHGQRTRPFIPHRHSGVFDEIAVLLSHNWITNSICLWRRAKAEVVGKLVDDGLHHVGDWYLYMRLLSEGSAYFVNEVLGYYRLHGAAESDLLVTNRVSGPDHIHFYDLIYDSERWPLTVRCLAKAHQIRWMTGEPMMSIVDKLGGERAHPIMQQMMENVRHDVIVGAAKAVLEYTPVPNALDTPAHAIAALKQVLKEAPEHAGALALLVEHRAIPAPRIPPALLQAASARSRAWITADLARHTPTAAITVLVDARQEGALRRTLRSLARQSLQAHRVVVIAPNQYLAETGCETLDSNALEHWLDAQRTTPGWLLGLAPGDELTEDALYHLARAIDSHPRALIVYSDHDQIGRDDRYGQAHHKPDINPELLHSTPYIGRAMVVSNAQLGRGMAPLDLVSSHAIALATLAGAGADAFAHVPAVLMHLDSRTATTVPTDRSQTESLNALVHAHAERIAPETTVIDGPGIGQYAWLPALPATPLVSIIIPTKDQFELLERCLETLLGKTRYPAFEVIVVDNESTEPQTRALLDQLAAGVDARVRVLRHPGAFNFSAINNRAAAIAGGKYLVLLNNDTEVIDPLWLTTMMRHAQHEGVGVVGPLLVFPNGRIQHAGVVLGLGGPADHPFGGQDPEKPGYLGRAQLQQNYCAVTGACLLTPKALYQRLDGLDESAFAVSYNDVDYCLRVREAGLAVVWTPLARVLHVSSASQLKGIEGNAQQQRVARFLGEQRAFYARWAPLISRDPAYNPNLDRARGFCVEPEPLLRYDPTAELAPCRLLALVGDDASSSRHRLLEPLSAQLAAGLMSGGLLPVPQGTHLILQMAPSHVVSGLPRTFSHLEHMPDLSGLPAMVSCFDGDDLLRAVPYLDSDAQDLTARLGSRVAAFIRGFARVLVSNPRLATALQGLHECVKILPQRLHPVLWADAPDPCRDRAQNGPMRIAWWQGPGTDEALIAKLIDHFGERVEFLCVGEPPKALMRRVRHLTPDSLHLAQWLATQHWDISIAPIRPGVHAELGSDIDLQRLAWFGRPVLCSDVPAHDTTLPVQRVSEDPAQWTAQIDALLASAHECLAAGSAAQAAVLASLGSMDDYLADWYRAMTDVEPAMEHTVAPATPPMDLALLAQLIEPLVQPRADAAASDARTPPLAEAADPSSQAERPDGSPDSRVDETRAAQRAQVTLSATTDGASRLLDVPYASFLDQRQPMVEDMQFIQSLADTWATAPTMHVLVEARASEFELLSKTLDSLGAQPYGLWALSIVSPSPCPDPAIAQLPNIDWAHDESASLQAKQIFDRLVAERQADVVCYVPPGTVFDPLCLWRIAHEFNRQPSWQAVYTDDDVMRTDDQRVEPRFKPDFNLDLLFGTDYIGALWTRRALWQAAGGLPQCHGTRFYDLTLRVLEAAGPEAIGHVADPLMSLPVSPTVLISDADAHQALSAHLTRGGIEHTIRPGPLHGTWHAEYQHANTPAVDIVIPYHNWLEFIEPLVDSIFRLTRWPNYRLILVDAGSTDADCALWQERIRSAHGDRISCLSAGGPWNWSALFASGARSSDAPYVLFLHHDTQVLAESWLDRLMAHAMRPGVAAVAPRQLLPGDNSLDMAGTIFGISPGIGTPEAHGTPPDYPGYQGRLQLTQNFSLLDSACLLVPRDAFDAVGGFDPRFGLSDAITDLTARLAKHGRLVWTPTVTIAHYGTDLPPFEIRDEFELIELSSQRQVAQAEERIEFIRRYQTTLARDPAWNINLRLLPENVEPETTFVPPWHAIPAQIPRIVADVVAGAGEYRATGPLRAARRAGKAMGAVIRPPSIKSRRMLNAIELARLEETSSFLIHNPALKEQMPVLQQMRTHLPDLPIIGLLDDLSTAVPHQSDLFDQWSRETRSYMRRCLSLCDRLVVSTPPLAEFARHMVDDIRIVPNRLEWARWGQVKSQRRISRRPRVGWAGAFQHAGDLALIEEAVRLTSHEVDWVFFGMCPAALAPYVKEHHTWVTFDQYPEKLANLNLDLAVAPLESNAFNDAKSNLRLLDYGILGWPVVCSDVTPYQNAPVTRVPDNTEAWVEAIRAHVHDLDAAEQLGDRLHEWVLADYILEEHVDEWLLHHLP